VSGRQCPHPMPLLGLLCEGGAGPAATLLASSSPLTLPPAPTLPMSLVEATATLGVGPTSLSLCHIITPVPCPPLLVVVQLGTSAAGSSVAGAPPQWRVALAKHCLAGASRANLLPSELRIERFGRVRNAGNHICLRGENWSPLSLARLDQ